MRSRTCVNSWTDYAVVSDSGLDKRFEIVVNTLFLIINWPVYICEYS